jgi:hypothetical protein
MKPAPPVTTTVDRAATATRALVPSRLVSIAPAQELGRHAGDDRECRHVPGDHGAGADDRALPHRHAGQQHRVDADVGPRAHAHRLDAQVGLDDRHVRRHPRVLRAEHAGTRPPPHGILEHQIARVEGALRPQPAAIADDAAAVEAPLDEGQLADHDAVADLECLRMARHRAAADAHAVAEALRQRPPHGAAHPGILGVVTIGVARGQIEQRLARVVAAQPVGELELVGRVGRNHLPAVYRRHHSRARLC